MNVWKDLLFLGGHVATPAGLEALGLSQAVPTSPPATEQRKSARSDDSALRAAAVTPDCA